jgi:hypothetical protein
MLFYALMSSRVVRLLLSAVLLSACAPAVVERTSTPIPSLEVTVGRDPVLAPSQVDASYVLPGAAVAIDGTVHLWAVAFGASADDDPRLVHLRSADGEAWGEPSDVVLRSEAIDFDAVGPVPSSALVAPDGTWLLYGGGRLRGTDASVLWRATAPGPDGPWRMHPNPILGPRDGAWDGRFVDHPSVLATGGGYLMAYGGSGLAAPNRTRIGLATSPDGITWTRVAATLDGADDAEALGASACGIDARSMVEPHLLPTSEGYRLYFGAMRAGGDEMVIGVARSADGRAWRCDAQGPVIEAAEIAGASGLHSYLAVRSGTDDLLLVEGLDATSAHSDLWLARVARGS